MRPSIRKLAKQNPPTSEATPSTAGLPASDKLPSGRPRSLGLFLGLLGDILGAAALFVMLFIALFAGSVLS